MTDELTTGARDGEALVVQYLETGRADLRDLIILHYSSMVERIARKFSGFEQTDDLVQVGYIGLLNALSKFDPNAGVRFNTYATHLVTGEIKHYLRDKTQTIRHPAWLQELRHKVTRTAARLTGELGRVPTHREIAESAGISEDAVQDVYATQDLLRVGSLDVTPEDDEGESDLDRLDSGMMEPDQLGVEERMLLEGAISQLRDLEQQVLTMFHFEALNQTEIASRLGISCNYVSHILRQSLNKLRKILVGEERLDAELRPESNEECVLDPATGIYSDRYFRSRITEEVHRVCGTDSVVSVILLELKGMNSYKSFYGAEAASELLMDLGAMLKQTVRTLDVVCRFGPTGFGIILPATGPSVTIACRRVERAALPWLASRVGSSKMRLQIGFATAPDDTHLVAELLAVATPGARDFSEPVELRAA